MPDIDSINFKHNYFWSCPDDNIPDIQIDQIKSHVVKKAKLPLEFYFTEYLAGMICCVIYFAAIITYMIIDPFFPIGPHSFIHLFLICLVLSIIKPFGNCLIKQFKVIDDLWEREFSIIYYVLVKQYNEKNGFGIWDGVIYSYNEHSKNYCASLIFGKTEEIDNIKGYGKTMESALNNLWIEQKNKNGQCRKSYEKQMGESKKFKNASECQRTRKPFFLTVKNNITTNPKNTNSSYQLCLF